MSDLTVLDAGRPDELGRWLALLEAWPASEPFAHPSYVRLFARPQDRVLCAALGNAAGGALFPFILRPLALEPWAGRDELASDITSPYGYGGAFAWGSGPAKADEFWQGFDAWSRDARVVSVFVRLALFADEMLPFRGTVEPRFENVVCDVTRPPDVVWSDYAHKVRKNVNKARRSSLTVEVDETGARLDDFLGIYEHTMDRRDAADRYYFPRELFETIVREMPGRFAFFHVLLEGRVVSTELVLVSRDHVYSYLGGTLADAFDLRPNDLLKHEVIEWARTQGKRAFVLGGGYGANDGIFRYKLSFAPGGSVPFSIGTRILDPAENERLVTLRTAYERENGRDWSPSPDSFPPYRS